MSWEVRTMRSGTSYFNLTLVGKNLARFWPIWGLYTLIWVVLMPVGILIQRDYWTAYEARAYALRLIGGASPALVLAFCFGILAAMAVFSYLYSTRSVGMFHALPMRREGLFLTNYLSGLAFLIIPNIAIFLLGLAAEALNGKVVFSSLFTWLVVTCLLCLFFYSFAVFCAMFTGHILALPAFYVILSFLVPTLAYLLETIARQFLFGFTGAAWMEEASEWFSPALKLAQDTVSAQNDTVDVYQFRGLGLVTFYALIGLVLAGVALALYRRRHLERAGDVITVGWMRPVFRYGVSLCAAVALGTFFYSIFYALLPTSPWILLGWMLLWGAAGCFIAEMLLRKRFWVFKSSWKGCVVFLLCLCVGMGTLERDVMGFETAVPNAAQVESVCIYGPDTNPRDGGNDNLTSDNPEVIQDVLDLHTAITQQKDALEAWQGQSGTSEVWTTGTDGVDLQVDTSHSLIFTYNMKDGSVIQRNYAFPTTLSDLEDPNSLSSKLTAILNRTDVVYDSYFGDVQPEDQLASVAIVNLYNPEEDTYGFEYLPTELLEPLMEAIKTDIAEGNLGRRYLLEDRERMDNCCYADLELTYRMPAESSSGIASSADSAYGPTANAAQEYTYTVTITLQKSAVHTLEVLKDYPNAFLSQAEVQLANKD